MQSLTLAALSILMLVLVSTAQNSATTPSDVNERVQHLMDVQVGFTSMVPPGKSIEAKEVSRAGKSGKDMVVQYHIFVKGVPPDTLFQEISWPPTSDKPLSALDGISVGKDGVLMCAGKMPEQCGDSKKPDDPIEFTMMPLKGEASRFAFVAPGLKIGIVIVPDPVEAVSQGCSLSAVRLTPGFELAFLSGSGYAPNTEVHYRVSSEKTNDFVIKSDSSGTIRVSVIPFPGGKSTGKVRVKITEPKCAPEISYEWGKQ
jgi:hypothetical protein